MTTYPLWVCAGIVAAVVIGRLQPDARPDLVPHRGALLVSAALGAVIGAYLLELPADLWGWSWSPTITPDGYLPLGGRTVLGGLLGGWLAVEWMKYRRQISGSTGDNFAAPLAAALAFGRLGCVSAGCCAGRECQPDCWWGVQDSLNTWRFATAHADAAFHALALVWLIVAQQRDWLRGRRLAIYLSTYAALRFYLEFYRANPAIGLGLTWYQWLALGLFLVGMNRVVRHQTERSPTST